MICRNCGAENPDYYVFCQNCFADLSKEKEANTPSVDNEQPSGYDAPTYEDDSDLEQTAYTPADEAEPAPPYPPSYEEEEEEDAYAPPAAPPERTPPAARRPAPPPAPTDKAAYNHSLANSVAEGISPKEMRKIKRQVNRDTRELEKLQSSQGAEYYDYYDYYDEAALKREKTRNRKTGLIIWIVLIVLVAAAATFGILYVTNTYGSLQEAVSVLFGGRQPVLVEEMKDDEGRAAHRLTIKGKVGETLRFTNLKTPQEVPLDTNDPVGYRIDDDQWIPVDPDPNQATIQVQPIVLLVDKNGKETQLEVTPYDIDVPQANLTISEPAVQENNVVTEQNILNIMGQALSGNQNPVTLSVAGQDITTPGVIQADGTFRFGVPLENGPYTIDITAKANYCRPITITLTGTYAGSDQPFVVDENVALRSAQSNLTVTGQGPISQTGETMTVTGGSAGDIAYDPSTGRFSFMVRLTQPINKFTMAVGTQNQELNIYLVPEVNAYANEATALDYNYVMNNASQAFNKKYFFRGTIASVTQEQEPYKFIVNMVDNPAQQIAVTYYGLVTPAVGTEYQFYATSSGKSSDDPNMLGMECYFMYSKEILDGLQASAPAASEDSQ